eukprot:2903229-Amphidinium_carterae.2
MDVASFCKPWQLETVGIIGKALAMTPAKLCGHTARSDLRMRRAVCMIACRSTLRKSWQRSVSRSSFTCCGYVGTSVVVGCSRNSAGDWSKRKFHLTRHAELGPAGYIGDASRRLYVFATRPKRNGSWGCLGCTN